MSKVKFLPLRTDILYHDNTGYKLTMTNLPWGAAEFIVKRYRISDEENLDLVDTKMAKGTVLHMSHPLSPNTLELIVLQKREGK